MSSLNALSRTSSIATERRGGDASSGAGGAFQSIQDAFAAMMGELGISADGASATGQTPATQDATAKTEPPQGALATLTGGSIPGTAFFDLSHLILSPTTAPNATGEQANAAASGAGLESAATPGLETDATTDPLGLALIAAAGVAPATTASTTTDAATTLTDAAVATATQAATTSQDGARAVPGATPPGLPLTDASPSEVAKTAMATLGSLLGLGTEASADEINAAVASVRASLPQTGATAVAASVAASGISASGKKPTTATNGASTSTAASSANGVPVAGATAAFEGDGATGSGSGSGADTGGETANPNASASTATLAQPVNANQRGGNAQSTSPLMAAALSFVERMQADQDSAEAEADALGAATSATAGRTDTAALQSTAAASATAGREAAVPLPLLATEIARQAQQGKKAFDIRLDPPELGKVRVKLELGQEGEVRAHLIVERKETLDMLQRDQRVLERALQDAGLSLNGGGLQFSLSNGGQQSSYEQASADTATPLTEADDDAPTVATAVATYTASRRPGGVDLSV